MSLKHVVFASIALFASTSIAAEPSVSISDMFARPTPSQVGVAFFTANSTTDDAITGISSDCCKAVEIHRTDKFNGVMSMRHIAALTLERGEPARVQPESKGGEHVMLIGLKEPLAEGDTVKITFTFKKAPSQTVVFPVSAEKSSSATHELH